LANRLHEIEIDINNMSVKQKLEPGKVLILVLDGHQGKAKLCEAVHHGYTIIETAKGKAARISYEESELF